MLVVLEMLGSVYHHGQWDEEPVYYTIDNGVGRAGVSTLPPTYVSNIDPATVQFIETGVTIHRGKVENSEALREFANKYPFYCVELLCNMSLRGSSE